jgi:hypothetical protein
VLKIYFDGSGKEDNQCSSLTLGGFASTIDQWEKFEEAWLRILDSHSAGLTYFHMAEAINPDGYFRHVLGWDLDKVLLVCRDLNALLAAMPKDRFCGFRYTVDLTAYRRWRTILHLPEASQKCAQEAMAKVYEWYGKFDMPIIGPIEIFFDHNESFLRHIYRPWVHPERNREFWGLVKTVAPVDSKHTPPVQASDMLAWCANRLRVGPANSRIDEVCRMVVDSGSATWSVIIDEDAIKGEYCKTVRP